ncbi:MAG: hypothetical protein HOP12_10455 [Candidatus Eisenbacteria bacterium]|uniref:DinB-like domain-containing protein n=1 Tax=Eiseniibacteriota bacterium TaxID=2212470 RepID=A0A849SFQ6_UNCEI|nr:hypothetical protein [Candidatus Eisenbacteria bacterium]
MTVEERTQLIARYAAGVQAVDEALQGFPASEWTARPIAGKWTAREIIHHLADSETLSALRIRKLLTEEQAVLQGYDQDHYAVRLRYNERDHTDALVAFRAARRNTVPVLEAMTDADWQRAGTHTEAGPFSAERWLKVYAAHAHGHAEQLERLKAALKGA